MRRQRLAHVQSMREGATNMTYPKVRIKKKQKRKKPDDLLRNTRPTKQEVLE